MMIPGKWGSSPTSPSALPRRALRQVVRYTSILQYLLEKVPSSHLPVHYICRTASPDEISSSTATMLHPTQLASAILLLASLAHTSRLQIPLHTSSSHGIGSMPLLGFGTWNVATSNASDVVSTALITGYRHLDCAAIYGNEREVGEGIARGLAQAGLKREDIWITSKLWNDQYGLPLPCSGKRLD